MENNLPVYIAFITATLRIATPLIFAALGAVITEKSGVTNVGIEGIMIMGAFFAVVGTQVSGSPYLGIAFGALAGAVVALVHGFLSITLKADQVISGTAINILATAIPSLLLWMLFQRQGQSDTVPKITYSEGVKSFLMRIPLIGPFLADLNYFVLIAIILVILINFILNKTRWGLRLKAVGEHPEAADTLGISVVKMRYIAVIISGILAALGGVSLAIVSGNLYREGMINGRGFIAIAAMIFGNWNPVGALLASLLFGAAEALQIYGQALGLNIPSEVYYALPYILTMIAVTGFVKKSRAPKAIGKPYYKGQR